MLDVNGFVEDNNKENGGKYVVKFHKICYLMIYSIPKNMARWVHITHLDHVLTCSKRPKIHVILIDLLEFKIDNYFCLVERQLIHLIYTK